MMYFIIFSFSFAQFFNNIKREKKTIHLRLFHIAVGNNAILLIDVKQSRMMEYRQMMHHLIVLCLLINNNKKKTQSAQNKNQRKMK